MQVVDINKFSSIRKDYEKLSKLYDAINNRISLIVIVCFTSNMFFIVFQLFNSLKRIEDITEKVYFHTSFALIVLRTTCLCILGGEIYEEWRNIATFLFSIRSAAYNEEVTLCFFISIELLPTSIIKYISCFRWKDSLTKLLHID